MKSPAGVGETCRARRGETLRTLVRRARQMGSPQAAENFGGHRWMKLPLLIMIGTCFAMMIVTPLLVALAMLALPGRKGRMRTVREVFHAGVDADATRTLYAERLGYDGFVLSPAAADPASLEATKPKRPTADAAVGAHADKSLSVRLDFAPDPARRGVHVRATAWVNDFIFYDTGEGRLIDAMLDRLLRADLDKEPRPVVPNVSFMALSAMVTA